MRDRGTTVQPTEPCRRSRRGRLVLWGLLLTASAATVAGYVAWAAPRRQIPRIDFHDVHADVAAAIQAAMDAVRQSPRSGAAWGRLGMMLHAHEYYTEAVTCYQLASQCDRQEFRWPYLLANLLENHDREAAAAAYRRAIEIQPELAQLHIRLAELCLDLGEFEQAEGELKTALESAPLNGQAQFRMAQLFFQRRDFATSLPWAKRAAEREPPRREVHELLLQLYHRLGEDEKSSEESRLLRTAAFAGGYWPDPYFEELKQLRRDPLWVAYQADQLLHAGNVPAALVILEQLVQQQPDDDVAREHLARALLHAHQQERAAEILDQGLARLPRSCALRRLRGALYLLSQQWPQAVQEYRQALAVKADDAASHLDLGYCLSQLGEVDPALAEFREAIRFQPDFIEPRLQIARLLLKQGQAAAAQTELRAVLELSPQNAEARELLKPTSEPALPAK